MSDQQQGPAEPQQADAGPEAAEDAVNQAGAEGQAPPDASVPPGAYPPPPYPPAGYPQPGAYPPPGYQPPAAYGAPGYPPPGSYGPPPGYYPPPGYGPPGAGWQQPMDLRGPAPGVYFAGPGARLGAYILDVIIIGFVTGLLSALLFLVGAASMDWAAVRDFQYQGATFNDVSRVFGPMLALIPGFLAIGLLGLLYFPFFWARGGQTPGMRVTGIRVVRDRDGGPVGWGMAIIRLIGYWVSGVIFYLGFIWVLIDSRRRGWHDLIAGTCVISDQ